MADISVPTLAAEPLFHIGSWPITNAILGTWLAMAILLGLLFVAARKPTMVPGTVQNGMETVIDGLRGVVNSVMEDDKLTNRYLPLIITIFLFVLILNWVALLPGFGTVGIMEHGELVPFLRAGSSDLNLTFAMAGVAFLVAQFSGIVLVGLFKYFNKFIHLSSLFKRPYHWKNFALFIPMFLLGLVELISEVAKFVALSFRLFGNIYAGEVLLVVFGTLLPVFIPLSAPFYILEVFVGLIQAFVFAMLTIVFVKIASLSTEH
ncbi:ATP synthase F0 subunit A [Patescibacteria group bacterium]|nr:ATP synthase F0 subunit A [Patescibacteria group bacterium]